VKLVELQRKRGGLEAADRGTLLPGAGAPSAGRSLPVDALGGSRLTGYQRSLLALLAVAVVASCVGAPYPRQMYLQHSPTVIALIGLPLLSRRFPLSNAAFTCLVAFLLVHTLGARYIYSYVPYDRWSKALFGFEPSSAFGFRRNHYDRVVHFCFGLLWVRLIAELCARHLRVSRRFAYYTACEFVLAASMLYELFEWSLTLLLSPHDAGAYNGQQGDIWDAHKDMSLALLGALVGLAACWIQDRRRRDF
jgi:putative membrane protein